MNLFKTFLFATIATLGFVACSTSQKVLDTSKASAERIHKALNNTSWVLKRIDSQKRDFIATKDQKELILNFSDNYYNTSDGCNGQGGEIEIKDNNIIFNPGRTTLAICGEEMKHLIYRVSISETNTILIKGDILKLIDKDGVTIATYQKKDAE